jgi:UDP-glucose 4-epimerase
MKVLVFGGNGRLGRDLQRFTVDLNELDVTYTRSPSTNASNLPQVDVTDAAQILAAVRRYTPDVILHLASITGAAADADPERATAVNLTSMAHVIDAAREHSVARIVFVSSSGVYGDRYDSPVGEDGALAPASLYARTKLAAEDLLRQAVDKGEIPAAVILRVFNMFGEKFDGSLVSRLLASTAESPVALRGPDNFVRDYIHVDDVMPSLISSFSNPLASGVATYNIGSGVPVSNRQLVDDLSRFQPIHTIVTAGERSYSCADIRLATRDLGLSPSRSLNSR